MSFYQKNRNILLALFCAGILSVGVISLTYGSTPQEQSLSKFTTGTPIASQNAASNWSSGTDNPFKSKLSSVYVERLDILTSTILKKGSNMSNTQFMIYLGGLSKGITAIGAKSQYINNEEVQNVLGFLVYEINSAVSALAASTDVNGALGEVATLINSSQNSSQYQSTGAVQPVQNTQVQPSSSSTIQTVDQAVPPSISSQGQASGNNQNTIVIQGIPHRVEGYDLSKSAFEYDYNKQALKSRTHGVTFDFNWNIIAQQNVFNTIMSADDFCKAKGRGYRLPKTYELKIIFDLYDSISQLQIRDSAKGTYRLIRNDGSNQVGGGSLLVPDFLSLEQLSLVSRGTPINGTVAIDIPSYGTKNNYDSMLFKIQQGMFVAKSDDGKYYRNRADGYSQPLGADLGRYLPEHETIQSPLCVFE